MTGSEMMYDTDLGMAVIINETTIPDSDVFAALQAQHPEYATLTRWGSNLTSGGQRRGGITERDRYLTPNGIFDQFKIAQDAAESDDVVSGVLETTESLTFKSVSIECEDEKEEDVWNQIAKDIKLEDMFRQMWRETFIISQFYAGITWTSKNYSVKRKTEKGNRPKKSFGSLKVPSGVTIFDPLKIVPVGNIMFGQEKLAWIASRDEAEGVEKVLAGVNTSDLSVTNFISERYSPTRSEKKFLKELTGANMDNLFIMNGNNVFRHTSTRPDYMRLASVRMKAVFELLDLKNQLRQMDRSFLLGANNFIILVKKGSDAMPAKQHEVTALAGQIQSTSRVPVIVGDHRIEIEIITPPMENVLKPERYNGVDARIAARLYQILMTGNFSAGAKGDDSIKLVRVIAAGMEARRAAIAETVMTNVIKPIWEKNPGLTSEPSIMFNPQRIALDFDPNYANLLLDLRSGGDLSRQSLLSEFDFDQSAEARKRSREKELYDDIFEPTGLAAAKQEMQMQQKVAGRVQGGNSNGGGSNRQSARTGPPRGEGKPEGQSKDKKTE